MGFLFVASSLGGGGTGIPRVLSRLSTYTFLTFLNKLVGNFKTLAIIEQKAYFIIQQKI